MQRLVLSMFAVVMLGPYFSNGDLFGRFRILPSPAALMPEALSVLALLLVIGHGLRNSFRGVRAAYALAFAGLLLVAVCGAIINHVGSGPIIAGLRIYCRAVPWFFVPLVYRFTDAQLRTQLKMLLPLMLLQLPLAIEQRIQTANPYYGYVAVTGDSTTGTMGDSGILSIILIASACFAVAFYERNEIRPRSFITLFVLLLLPTTINETKATIFFVPFALLMTVIVAAPPAVRAKRLLVGIGLIVTFGAVFVPIYDWMNEGRQYSSTLESFLSNPDSLKSYLAGEEAGDVQQGPGRIDSITVPLTEMSKDASELAFGYGIGNASISSLGPAFAGAQSFRWQSYMQSALARSLLELGVLGVSLFLIILWLIFCDCLVVARHHGSLAGAIAAGWSGVVVMIVMATIYVLLESSPPISYLFWYFSGIVAAARMRLDHEPGVGL